MYDRIILPIKKSVPLFIPHILKIYLFGLFIFLLLRIYLLEKVTQFKINLFEPIVFKSFMIGLQFDSVILFYTLILPILLLYIENYFFNSKKYFSIISSIIISIALAIQLIISIADIPYYLFFHSRITEASFQWMNSWKISLKMIMENNSYLFYLVICITMVPIFVMLFYKWTYKKLCSTNINNHLQKNTPKELIMSFIIMGFVCFIGLRGRIDSPLRTIDAIYCNNTILNQIALNPTFTLIKSYSDKVHLMDEDIALKLSQEYLNVKNPIESISHIARNINGNDSLKKTNIILVLMESMSANNLMYFGNKNNLTPNIDSLLKRSLFFENAYSAGIHTNNGIFSSLYSYPSLKNIRPMSTIPVRKFTGLPYTLKEYHYKNLFFTTHSEIFDNLSTFIPYNHFDSLYSSEDFPPEKSISTFGVPDDYLFKYAVNKFNNLDTSNPFFATILTTSNHEPYILPTYFNKSF